MKILNLYSGIGGNRKLWGDEHEITAVEYKPNVAKVYQDLYPNDIVIVGDAHEYLLEHFEEYDFIWSSPPCPSHSRVRFAVAKGTNKEERQNDPIYPSMALYQEILLLKHYFKGKWCVENVISYYEPLITPQELDNHYWWTNFHIRHFTTSLPRGISGKGETLKSLNSIRGFDLEKLVGIDKRLALRNCVEPEIGAHILKCAIEDSQLSLV